MSSNQNGPPFNNNVDRRNVNNRERQIQLMRRRIFNKLYQKCSKLTPVGNQDTLNRIANIPPQNTNNDTINQFFNGFSF
jgi:hypothetical protein